MEELREQQQRARVQGRPSEAERLQVEMEQLQTELAATVEMLATDQSVPEPAPELHDAEKLSPT
jgi:hypothetical protein